MFKGKGKAKDQTVERQPRVTINPGAISNLCLYGTGYHHFKLIGWPRGVMYPSKAEDLKICVKGQKYAETDAYQILAAFVIGSVSSNGERYVLHFRRTQWCKSLSFKNIFCMLTWFYTFI